MKKNDYFVQWGCHNCTRCVEIIEHDSPSTFYCRLGAPKRPKSGSVAMGGCWDLLDDKKYRKSMKDWDRWSKNREVEPAGICAKYKVKK